MSVYADTSFLVAVYSPQSGSATALRWMQRARDPLPFTPLHRHEFGNAVRLRVFRGEISSDQRKAAFREMESDLSEDILDHTPIPWTDAFRRAEALAEEHTEILGARSFDILHVALAFTL